MIQALVVKVAYVCVKDKNKCTCMVNNKKSSLFLIVIDNTYLHVLKV